MISYICNPLSEPFDYETVSDCLRRYAQNTPDKEAIVFYSPDLSRRSITFAEIYKNACTTARGLIALGIRPGEIVGLGLSNVPEWIYCHFGILLAGAVTLGYPYFAKNGSNIVQALNQSEKCTAIIFDTGENKEKVEIIRNIIQSTDDKGNISKSSINSLKFAIRVGADDIGDFPFTLRSLQKLGGENSHLVLPVLSPDDVCVIILSSGTTGHCKLIPKTHFHISSIKQMTNHVMRLQADDILFNASPFLWIGGYVTSLLNFGHKLVTMTNLLKFKTSRQFAELAVHVIEKEQCTIAGMYGPALLELLDDKHLKCSHFPLKCVITGGFPLSKAYAPVVGNIAQHFVNAYGSTELGSICYTDISSTEEFQDYIAGYPVKGIELKVVDENGQVCPRNMMGEVYVRSTVRFLGYVNDQDNTNKVLDNSGWFRTNDSGYLRDDDQLVVAGRMSDVIIVGGAKVSPVNLENIISSHPDILAVVVIAIEDKAMFQEACACLIKKPDSTVSWENIKAFIENKSIAKQESIYFRVLIPKYHIFVDSFPRTASGKVAKKLLKEDVLKALKLS